MSVKLPPSLPNLTENNVVSVPPIGVEESLTFLMKRLGFTARAPIRQIHTLADLTFIADLPITPISNKLLTGARERERSFDWWPPQVSSSPMSYLRWKLGARILARAILIDHHHALFLKYNCAILALRSSGLHWAEGPKDIKSDLQGRLHNETGPAVRWLDQEDYYWHGVKVPAVVVNFPESITLGMINNSTNAELKRVMVERYGEARYLFDLGVKPVDNHPKFGDLYVQRQQVGRPIAFMRVTNCSPEPDGSFRIYILRVNPDLYGGDAGRYAQAAAASTWRKTPNGKELLFPNWREYNPVTET